MDRRSFFRFGSSRALAPQSLDAVTDQTQSSSREPDRGVPSWLCILASHLTVSWIKDNSTADKMEREDTPDLAKSWITLEHLRHEVFSVGSPCFLSKDTQDLWRLVAHALLSLTIQFSGLRRHHTSCSLTWIEDDRWKLKHLSCSYKVSKCKSFPVLRQRTKLCINRVINRYKYRNLRKLLYASNVQVCRQLPASSIQVGGWGWDHKLFFF